MSGYDEDTTVVNRNPALMMGGQRPGQPQAGGPQQTSWEQTVVSLDPRTLARSPGETIVPGDRDRHASWTNPASVVSSLPKLSVSMPMGPVTGDLVYKQLLGAGGMGQVILAEQSALAREVAVKALKAEIRQSPGGMRALLQEAWLTGALEHPNIVSIHTLGRDDQGSPLIVMQRVEGQSWFEHIHRPEKTTAGIRTLDWHLNVLGQVCHAIEFAHSRGIVHRDLKPENVMIGRFGEVYVLDWGIAVSLRDDLGGRLPMAADSTKIAGTPGYMAPEMVAERKVDERTDVFLLGAILHELITGKTPNHAPTVEAALVKALEGIPRVEAPHMPVELIDICQKALALNPADRYPSARAFRQAIEAFLEHKSSIDLTRQAQLSLAQLRHLTQAEQPNLTQVNAAFGECRFGFQQALRIWSENTTARRGLDEALEAMAEHEIAQGNAASARALIDELSQRGRFHAGLQQRLDALSRQHNAQQQRMEELEQREQDRRLNLSVGARRGLLLVLAVLWLVFPLAAGIAEDMQWVTVSPRLFFAASVRVPLIVGLALLWMRETMFSTQANRHLSLQLLCLTIVVVFLRGLTALNGVSVSVSMALEMILYAFFVFVMALALSQRLVVTSTLYLIGAYIIHFYPALDDYVLGVCNMLVLINFASVLRADDRARPA